MLMTRRTGLPQAIQDQLVEIDKITDRLGMPIDEGVRLLVAALRARGFTTVDSCEGHEKRRSNGPRVWLTPKNSETLLRDLRTLDEESEDAKLLRRQIRDEGYRLRSRLLDLLDDFYTDRKTSTWLQIILESRGIYGDCVLICQGTTTVDAIKPDGQRLKWLALAKQEFADFTDFLI